MVTESPLVRAASRMDAYSLRFVFAHAVGIAKQEMGAYRSEKAAAYAIGDGHPKQTIPMLVSGERHRRNAYTIMAPFRWQFRQTADMIREGIGNTKVWRVYQE